jgi:hypothetical protein
MTFATLFGALAILAACCNLWWFAFASAAGLVWLHLAFVRAGSSSGIECSEVRRLRLSTATLLSLVSYALLLSTGLLTTRAALGLLELPRALFEQSGLAPAMQRSSLGFYDKSELRLALSELALLTVTFSAILVQAASSRALQRRRALVLHPASAAFAFVLYFAAVRLPPYPIHLEQWGALASLATSDSAWPSMRSVSPVLLGTWLSSFGLSPLSLSVAVALCNLVAGAASFVLIRRLTGSPVAAMFGASFVLLEATILHVASVMSPAPAHVALAMLLMYLSLHPRAGFPWVVFMLGLILGWDPLFGASASAGFLFALGCQAGRPGRQRAFAALLAGMGVSVAAIAIARSGLASLPLPGVALITQQEQLGVHVFPLFTSGLVLLALAVRRSGRFRAWTARRLFVCASMVCALPSTYLAAVRLDPAASLEVYWILVPIAALALYGLVRVIGRAARIRMRAPLSTGLSTVALVVLFDIAFPAQRLNQVVARYAVGYETERQNWYRACAAGKACDPRRKPTLALYLREAARPLVPSAGARRDPA